MTNETEIVGIARSVLDIEINGIQAIRDQIGPEFVKLVNLCDHVLNNNGKIVVSGIGKSGHIARKIAATLASTGSPAIFMHPVEAMHGDLGMLQPNDLLLALSYSGETAELTSIILPAKRLGIPVACFTGIPESTLGRMADLVVLGTVEREACPFNLAPTTTSTAHLALGDALAMTLLNLRGFTKEDYGMRHPSGAIGRAVSMRVRDLTRTGNHVAFVLPEMTVKEALLNMTSARCGAAIVVDSDRKLLGIFTDGDFRRRVENDLSVLSRLMSEVMTPNPSSISEDALAVELMHIFEQKKIDDVVVLDSEGRVQGLVDIQDLPSFKIM